MQVLILTIAQHLSAHIHHASDKIDSFKPFLALIAIKLFALLFISLGEMDHVVGIIGGIITGYWGLYKIWDDHKLKRQKKSDASEKKEGW